MPKIAAVYFSKSGNTIVMADAIVESAKISIHYLGYLWIK